VKGIDRTQARRARAAEFRDVHSRTNPGGRRSSGMLFGSVGCLGLVLLLLDLVLSQYDGVSFDGNTSSPPSLGHPGRQ
jgi:hypothetical protein